MDFGEHYPIALMPIETLKEGFDPANPHTHNDGDMQRMAGLIQEHGFLVPVLYNVVTKTLVDGELRVLSAERSGYENLPTVMIDKEEIEGEAVALATKAQFARMDRERLWAKISLIERTHYDLDYTGLKPRQVDDYQKRDDPKPSKRHVSIDFTDHDEPSLRRFLEREEIPAQLGSEIAGKIRTY